jgi:hypothetical protein
MQTTGRRSRFPSQFEMSPNLRPRRLHQQQQEQQEQQPQLKRPRYHSDSDWFQSDVEDELVRLQQNTGGVDDADGHHPDSDINALLQLVEAQ